MVEGSGSIMENIIEKNTENGNGTFDYMVVCGI